MEGTGPDRGASQAASTIGATSLNISLRKSVCAAVAGAAPPRGTTGGPTHGRLSPSATSSDFWFSGSSHFAKGCVCMDIQEGLFELLVLGVGLVLVAVVWGWL